MAGYRCPLLLPFLHHYLPIFTRRGSEVVDYSNRTEMSWYLSAWATCQTLVSRAGAQLSMGLLRDEKKWPQIAALLELSKPEMGILIRM